jgi:hypothetical protein
MLAGVFGRAELLGTRASRAGHAQLAAAMSVKLCRYSFGTVSAHDIRNVTVRTRARLAGTPARLVLLACHVQAAPMTLRLLLSPV